MYSIVGVLIPLVKFPPPKISNDLSDSDSEEKDRPEPTKRPERKPILFCRFSLKADLDGVTTSYPLECHLHLFH